MLFCEKYLTLVLGKQYMVEMDEQLIISLIDTRLKYLLQDPNNPYLLAELIELYLNSSQVDLALEKSEQARLIHGENERIQYLSINSAIACKQYEKAIEWLILLAEHKQPPIWVVYNYAYACMKNGGYAKSLEIIRNNSGKLGEYPKLYLVKARCQHFMSDYKGAHSSLGALLSIDPSDIDAKGLQSLIKVDMGNYAEAKNQAEAVLAEDPMQFEANMAIASVALSILDVKLANTHFDLALSKLPNSGRVLSGKGQIALLSRDYKSALDLFKSAVINMPNHIGTWHSLAWTCLILNDIEGCVESFQNSYELDRNFAESHGGLAVCAVVKNDSLTAKYHITRSLKLDKDNFTGRYAQSLLLQKNGHAEESSDIVNSILNSQSPLHGLPMRTIISQFINDDSNNEH